jgi:hypothetical protein
MPPSIAGETSCGCDPAGTSNSRICRSTTAADDPGKAVADDTVAWLADGSVDGARLSPAPVGSDDGDPPPVDDPHAASHATHITKAGASNHGGVARRWLDRDAGMSIAILDRVAHPGRRSAYGPSIYH